MSACLQVSMSTARLLESQNGPMGLEHGEDVFACCEWYLRKVFSKSLTLGNLHCLPES